MATGPGRRHVQFARTRTAYGPHAQAGVDPKTKLVLPLNFNEHGEPPTWSFSEARPPPRRSGPLVELMRVFEYRSAKRAGGFRRIV